MHFIDRQKHKNEKHDKTKTKGINRMANQTHLFINLDAADISGI